MSAPLTLCNRHCTGGLKSTRGEEEDDMGRIFVVELEGRSYRCKFCGTHLALPDQLVSKGEHHSGSPRGEPIYFVAVVEELLAGNMRRHMSRTEGTKKGSSSSKEGGLLVKWTYQESSSLIPILNK
uniref:Yippee domain-containing protein n=1 Tax=Salix viminalis TaxID=40686 RepID=A0A6N2ND19_SALVM